MTKPTLGVYGPKPPHPSAIAVYIAASIPSLSEAYEVTHVGNENYTDPRQFDRVLYHLGNNPLNGGAFEALRRRPGPIVLHEYINFGYYYGEWDTLPRGERKQLLELYARELGVPWIASRPPRELVRLGLKTLARGVDRSIYDRNEMLRMINARPDLDLFVLDAGLERIAISRATSVVLHGHAVLARLSERYPQKRFVKVELPVDPVATDDPKAARARFGLPPSNFIFATMGFGNRYKRIDVILEAWERWSDRPADATLCVIGKPQAGLMLEGREGVMPLGYVSDEDFESLLVSVDCGIQLRYPSIGETSAVIARFVANGMAIVVSDVPEMHDYDGMDGVVFVPIGEGEHEGLIDAMRAAYQRGRHEPRRREGYEWADWVERILPVLAE